MNRRRRIVAAACIVGSLVIGACSGSATAPNSLPSVTAETFVGFWKNTDPNTGSIPQLQIRVDAANIYVHSYGACIPTFCDWGEASTPRSSVSDGSFTVRWDFPNGIHETLTLAMTAASSSMVATVTSHFTDGSNRPDHTDIDSFIKSAQSDE